MVNKYIATLLLLGWYSAAFAQSGTFGMKQLTEDQKSIPSAYCLKNSEEIKDYLNRSGIRIKHETEHWIFVTCTADQLEEAYNQRMLSDYYMEYAPPVLLNDSARARHSVDQVHNGVGLSSSFKGKDVIMGYVDTGIDFNHPDFKDSNGNTRILRYWDHSTNTGGPASPYGYGIVWDSTHINVGSCTSMDGSAHGTTVVGAGSGNGLSTGYNQGMAPEADIIMVETNFNLPNWTLTVADACDYIFKVADSLGKPAVVNLSLGSYFGSHDGDDPAAEFIESLVDAQDGRIVVSACGNSGNIGKYHCHGDVDADTSFVWFINNPSGALGANTIFFDLYSDLSEATYDYTFRAVNPATNYDNRGELVYRSATQSVGVPIFDTIWNGSNRIATLEIYTEQVGTNFHMQGFVSQLDTTSYRIGFYTTGSGSFDLWTSQALGYNNMVTAVPAVGTFPSIVHYNMPDSLQTIVSSWNCSEKVISVGNVKNRTSFPNYAGGTYFPSDVIPPGKLSINSSKGPNRHNVLKPDIAASGDVILAPGPIWFMTNPANYNKVDTGGWHMTNGGTSMSSPVVAGIAALYLERCARANYQDFKQDLANHAFANTYTGTLPNFAYGNGLIHAHNMLLSNEFAAEIAGDTAFCAEPTELSITSSTTISEVIWSGGENQLVLSTTTPGAVSAMAYNERGCGVPTDTVVLVQLEVPVIDPITVALEDEELSTTSSTDYQWTLDGVAIPGATSSVLSITPPYGVYTCIATSSDGCTTETDPVTLSLGLEELPQQTINVYPNPTAGTVQFDPSLAVVSVRAIDISGRSVTLKKQGDHAFSLAELSAGTYFLIVETEETIYQTKVLRR